MADEGDFAQSLLRFVNRSKDGERPETVLLTSLNRREREAGLRRRRDRACVLDLVDT